MIASDLAMPYAIFHCLVSILVLFILAYIFIHFLINIKKIDKAYKLKVKENLKKISLLSDSDDYIYNDDPNIYQENENINQKIIKTLKKANSEQNKKLQNVIKLKKELNINNTINSRIDNTVLSEQNDNLQYTKPEGNFFSKLLFT